MRSFFCVAFLFFLFGCSNSQPGVLGVVVRSAPAPYGTMYKATSFASTSAFETSGSWTTSGGNLLSPGNTSAFATLPNVTCTEKNTVMLKYYCTGGSESEGPRIGFKSQNTWDPVSYAGYFNPTSKSVVLWTNIGGTTYPSSSTITGYVLGDTITLTLQRAKNIVTATALDVNKGTTVSVSTTSPYTRGAAAVPDQNTAKFCITAGSTTYAIKSVSWTIEALKYAPRILVGNSISHGAYAGSVSARFGELAGMEINSGSSDRTTEVLLRVPELISLAPKKVFLAIGTNDLGFGSSLATFSNNYSSIVSQLSAAGITVVELLLLPRNDYDVTSFNNWIKTRYPTSYIDTNTPLRAATGTGINSAYDGGDGLHPSTAGHQLIANTVTTSTLY